MVKTEEIPSKIGQNSIRYCGKCKREYMFKNFLQNYPEPYQDRIIKLWQNPQIRFYCHYCYLLKLIQEIKDN